MDTCIDCGGEVWRGPFCRRCYSKMAMRRWRTGTETLKPRPSTEERFLAMTAQSDGHWLWSGSTDEKGYGRFSESAGAHPYAHRWSYAHFVGEIPDGAQIDHICRVRNCVRPEHLRLATPQENSQYRASQITHCPQGHPYDAANTRWYKGHRRCLECGRTRSNAYQRRLFDRPDDVVANSQKDTCPAGHPYPPAEPGKKRACQVCMTLRMRARRGSKLADAPIRTQNAQKTHCPHGHAYDEANTYVTKTGHRLCRACHRERQRSKPS